MSYQQHNAKKINVCGIGPGNRELIVPEVFRLVAESTLVVGGSRHLEIFNVSDKETWVLRNNIEQIIEALKGSDHSVITVLVSGDTGFHSLLTTLLRHFKPTELNVIPGISSYQYFFAKLAMTYHDAWIGSVHGMTVDYVTKVKSNRKTFLLTDSLNSWKQIATHLSETGLGECEIYVGNRLSYPDEQIVFGTANELKEQQHDFELCSVIIINTLYQMNNYNQQLTAGIPDSEFIRGDVPMTKEEIRILSISKLQLTVGDCLLDVGAGTGSVSIEMARLLPESTVYAVEQKAKALELIRLNALKFETPNIKAIEGKAPDVLAKLSGVNKIFIGGSGGNLKEIIDWVERNCHTGSRVVINAVTLNTLIECRQVLSEEEFSTPEIIQVSINRIEKLGNAEMFRPQSPIFIISTTRL